ncbi:MAG: glycine/sarcosine/betaine reductase component B subunit [Dehalococcoidia bacterium]
MKLELASYKVKEINLGSGPTRLDDGVLRVDRDEVKGLALSDSPFRDVRLHVVHPGDSVRIVHALDVVEPRHKVSGPGTVFPGVLGPPVTVGEGRTHRLEGMTVMTVGEPVEGEPTYWREAIIDMSGPGAPYTLFSRTANLVLELIAPEVPPDVPPEDLTSDKTISGSKYSRNYNLATRVAGFKVASYLAQVTSDLAPDRMDAYELSPVASSLPKVVYASQEPSESIYGATFGWQPTIFHPNEFMDGAIFRSFDGPASTKDATYLLQNHAVVQDLYSRHGKELNFLGVVLYPFGSENLVEKERITSYAAKQIKMMGADGAVLTWIGGGHLGIDFMLLCRKCEQLGITTTLINPEMATMSGDSGFVHYVPEADAIVSSGNYERQVTLPAVDKVIGGTSILESGLDAAGSLTVPVRHLYGATSPLGASKMIGVQY